MITVLLVVHLLVAIFLVALILLQRSGGGALTAIMATLFFVTSISLSLYYKEHSGNVNRSILNEPAQTSAPAQAEVPAEAPAAPSAPTAEK